MMFLGEQILSERIVKDAAGNKTTLHSETQLEQCRYLQSLIHEIKPKVTLETGLAFGLSTLFICQAMKETGGEKHIVIDKFQHGEHWRGIGLRHISEAGFDSLVDFHESYAHDALTTLYHQGVQIDFAYLDASKIFDVVLTNLYFIDLMLSVGGIIALDDCRFPGIRKAVKYWSNHPNYEVHSTYGTRWFRRSARCVTFRKINDKERNWDWYQPF